MAIGKKKSGSGPSKKVGGTGKWSARGKSVKPKKRNKKSMSVADKRFAAKAAAQKKASVKAKAEAAAAKKKGPGVKKAAPKKKKVKIEDKEVAKFKKEMAASINKNEGKTKAGKKLMKHTKTLKQN